VIRGNDYDAVTDNAFQVSSLVDKKSQRAAWMVRDSKSPVYEVGTASLAKDGTIRLVHYG
jgi:hypothetical protein